MNATTPPSVLPSVFYQELDDEDFPEMSLGADDMGIAAQLLQPADDRRIAAPRGATVLLLRFGLMQDEVAGSPWLIEFVVPDAHGRPEAHRWQLVPVPPDGNHSQRLTRPPSRPPVPGMVYRGALWSDLGAMQRRRLLRPGLVLTVGRGPRARAQVTVR